MENWILLHGAFGSHHDLLDLSPGLSNAHVINMDLPFHGKDLESFNYEKLKAALLKKLAGKENYTFFGYSLGGYLVLDLASEKKIHPKKIVTYGTKFQWTNEVVDGIAKKMDLERLKAKAPQYYADLESKHSDVASFIQSSIQLMKDVSTHPMTREQFEKIECEVCLLVGDQDTLVSIDETKTVQSFLKQASLSVLENAPHALPSHQLPKYLQKSC